MVGNQAIDLNDYFTIVATTGSVSPDWQPRIEVEYSMGEWSVETKPSRPRTRLAGRAWLRPVKRRRGK